MRFIIAVALSLIASTVFAQGPLDDFFSGKIKEHELRIEKLEKQIEQLAKPTPAMAQAVVAAPVAIVERRPVASTLKAIPQAFGDCVGGQCSSRAKSSVTVRNRWLSR